MNIFSPKLLTEINNAAAIRITAAFEN